MCIQLSTQNYKLYIHRFLIWYHHHCISIFQMSSHSGGPSRNPHPSGRDKRTRTESSYGLGEALAPPSQRPCSTLVSEGEEGDWESAPPSPVPPSSLPFPMPSARPEPSQDDICHNIAFQARQLESLLHSVEGSSFGPANQPLEVLLENLLAFFFPKVASMVTSMDHVLLYAPEVPKKYGGTGPDPPVTVCVVPPRAPKAPPLPAPVAPPPAPRARPKAALLARAPPAPLSCAPHSFAEVAAASPTAPSLPKLVRLCKACTKQGTKATMALLRPSLAGPPSNASAIVDFMASKPLGDRIPVSQMVTLRGDWSLTFSEALTLPDLEQLQAALDTFHHPGAEVVNCPTSTSLKFPHVPTIHPDGSTVSNSDLLAALHSHPRCPPWRPLRPGFL
ncbi:hypothetical protein AX15_006523 [Amanita polypyramis BW_CC]|nr:hypothetical protein AX15_006523 [Amanita polypyramis BW_CC]